MTDTTHTTRLYVTSSPFATGRWIPLTPRHDLTHFLCCCGQHHPDGRITYMMHGGLITYDYTTTTPKIDVTITLKAT